MPVGSVFNAAANQVLISPVTNYYKGKAIRQQLEEGELDIEIKKAQLESIPASADAAARKEQRDIAAADRATKKLEMEIGKDNTRILGEAAAAYTIAIEEGSSPEESSGVFWDALIRNGFTEEQVNELRSTYDKDGDGVISAKEAPELKAFALSVGKMVQKDGQSPSNHQNYMMPDGSIQAARKDSPEADALVAAGGVVAGQKSTEKPKFDPPNKAELETAEKLLKTSEKLEDLDGRYKDIAAMILANDIRQLQERYEMPYEQAAALAIKSLEKKTSEESDFFSASDTKLNLAVDPGQKEYPGIDGKIYVSDGNGGFRARD